MTDDDKALVEVMKDAVIYGTGFMKDGKHIPIEDVYLDPRDVTIAAQAAEIEGLKHERDKLIRFVNSLIEEHGLEYQGVVVNDD